MSERIPQLAFDAVSLYRLFADFSGHSHAQSMVSEGIRHYVKAQVDAVLSQPLIKDCLEFAAKQHAVAVQKGGRNAARCIQR